MGKRALTWVVGLATVAVSIFLTVWDGADALSNSATKWVFIGSLAGCTFLTYLLDKSREDLAEKDDALEKLEKRLQLALFGTGDNHYQVALSVDDATGLMALHETPISVSVTGQSQEPPEQIKIFVKGASVRVFQNQGDTACTDFVLLESERENDLDIFSFKRIPDDSKGMINTFHLAFRMMCKERTELEVTVNVFKSALSGPLSGTCKALLAVR